jgi:histidine ammonia-lyase
VWQPCTQGVNGALNACPRDHDSHPTQPYRPDSGTVALITLGGHQGLTREAVEAVAWGGELLAARQAWWLRRAAPAAGLRGIAARLAELAAPVDRDRPLGGDLATIVAAPERDELPLP